MLSTPFTFKVLTPEQRVWHALQQRELLHNAATRTPCFRLCREAARVRQLLAETTSEEVTSQMTYVTYKKISMYPHRAGTLSFYNIINTVLQKLLGVSDIHTVLDNERY